MLLTIKFILNHPITRHKPVAAIAGFVKWQLVSRLRKTAIVHKFTPNSKLYVWNGLKGATGNVYCGLHDFEDMAFLLHFLRPDDLFVDVGANIGSYTILASAEVGASSVALEPVKASYHNLLQNIKLNNIADKVQALNIGAGSKEDVLYFTNAFDAGNHVAAKGDEDNMTDAVAVDSLDNLLAGKCPAMLKIDVEGFETEVLNGAAEVLRSVSLKAVIIELNGSGGRYGYNEENIHQLLLSHGFKPYAYMPFDRKLIQTDRKHEHNTLYLRNILFVEERIYGAGKITVKGISF